MSQEKKVESPVGKKEFIELVKQFDRIVELQFIWKNAEDDLDVQPISRGDVNYNCRFYSKSQPLKSVFVKFAAPQCKNAPSIALPVERLDIEYHSMCYSHCILPESVPRPFLFCADTKIAMYEYLDGYEDLEELIVAGNFNIQTFADLAKILGKLHHAMHRNTVGEERFAEMAEQIHCEELHNVAEQFYFKSGFTDEAVLAQLQPQHVKRSVDFRQDEAMQALLEQVRSYTTRCECLIHNDLHFNSVMVKKHTPKLIDFEFARVGNPARDVGMVLAQMVALYYYHLLKPKNNAYHRQLAYKLREACDTFLEVYFEHLRTYTGPEEEFKQRMTRHVAGFMGVELVARVLSSPHIARIQAADHVTGVETEMLECGLRVLKKHESMDSFYKMFFIGFMEC